MPSAMVLYDLLGCPAIDFNGVFSVVNLVFFLVESKSKFDVLLV